MGTYSRYPGSSFGFRSYFPKAVKWLLIINFALFIFLFFLFQVSREMADAFMRIFGLSAAMVVRGAIWQPFTYLFLHGGFYHVLFNMLTLWMFGSDLEREWGTRRFLSFYFLCGVGAGVCDLVANLIFGSSRATTIGASGAVYGVLLAFGMLYPNRTVFFSLLFPIPAKYFVLIIGAIAFMSSFDRNSGVSNIAHLGGMLFGYLYLRFRWHQFDQNLAAWYQNWRRRRLQQKFKVYMRKQQDDRRGPDQWVN